MRTVIINAQQKWECIAIDRRSEIALMDEINVLGQKGWELVSAMYYRDTKANALWSAFLKRPSSGPVAMTTEDTAIEITRMDTTVRQVKADLDDLTGSVVSGPF